MNLHDRAIADIRKITTNDKEWAVNLAFEAPAPGSETASVKGLKKKHHTGFDTDGNRVNVRDASVTVAEALLTEASYPVRNAAGEVTLRGHKVTVADSNGTNKTYIIEEWYPDESMGLIVCQLGKYSE